MYSAVLVKPTNSYIYYAEAAKHFKKTKITKTGSVLIIIKIICWRHSSDHKMDSKV